MLSYETPVVVVLSRASTTALSSTETIVLAGGTERDTSRIGAEGAEKWITTSISPNFVEIFITLYH